MHNYPSDPVYIWQQAQWRQTSPLLGAAPAFTWQTDLLKPMLDRVRLLQGRLLGVSESVSQEQREAQLDTLVQNVLRTSEIEGEVLNAESVRSSVIRQLGLVKAGFVPSRQHRETAQTSALVELLIEATSQYNEPLTFRALCQWQAALFPEPPRYQNLIIGDLRGQAPMQVISGRTDNPTVHFEAPPRQGLEQELQRFIDWFNQPSEGLDPLLRAGIAHLWLITLHPFDDGNGRVTRAVTDRALAQAEHQSIRFYSLSAAIMARRKEYYDILEQSQKGPMDITPWVQWFLSVLEDAISQGLQRFQRVLNKTRFWQRHAQTVLSERQIKVLNRLLDTQGEEFTQGINASKYMSLAKISKATATRELADLVAKNCLSKLPGGGRSTRYTVAHDFTEIEK
ncbi:MAG TPA: Fic family protein [Marinagarivorans sp.]